MDLQAFYGKEPHPLLWAGSRAAHERISGITSRLNYCAIFIVYIQFTNVAAGRIRQPGGPLVGDALFKQLAVNKLCLPCLK